LISCASSLAALSRLALSPTNVGFFFTTTIGHAVHIELQHIRHAMDKQGGGEITTEQLSDWAAMLLADPSYDWEGPDEEEIAGWLNEMAVLRAPRAGGRAVYEHVIDASGKTVSFVQKV
jgi:hypothetical protein